MQDCKEFDVLSVTTTVGSRADAERVARALVQERLVACAQLEPGLTSFYRWEGALCEEAEARLTLKTVPSRLEALRSFLGQHHPYALPQFLVAGLRASPDYAAWVRGEVTPAGPAQTPGR